VRGRHFGGFLVQAALRWLFGLELGLFGVCVKIRRKSSQNANKSQRKSKKVKESQRKSNNVLLLENFMGIMVCLNIC
jgi:hypothetical protein